MALPDRRAARLRRDRARRRRAPTGFDRAKPTARSRTPVPVPERHVERRADAELLERRIAECSRRATRRGRAATYDEMRTADRRDPGTSETSARVSYSLRDHEAPRPLYWRRPGPNDDRSRPGYASDRFSSSPSGRRPAARTGDPPRTSRGALGRRALAELAQTRAALALDSPMPSEAAFDAQRDDPRGD